MQVLRNAFFREIGPPPVLRNTRMAPKTEHDITMWRKFQLPDRVLSFAAPARRPLRQ